MGSVVGLECMDPDTNSLALEEGSFEGKFLDGALKSNEEHLRRDIVQADQ